jgi:hypothetical protein
MVVKSATKKRMMDLGVPEVLAHALADEMKWGEWRDLPLKGRNSGFKKQFFKRVKPVARKMNNLEWERNRLTQLNERQRKSDDWTWTTDREMLEHEKYIMTVAALNEDVVELFYQMVHYLPLLKTDVMFPEIPSQGLFNWVSFSGEQWEKQSRVRYEQALTVFNVGEYDIKRKQSVERDVEFIREDYKNPYDYYEDKHPDWTKKYQPYYKDPKNYAQNKYTRSAALVRPNTPEYDNYLKMRKDGLYQDSPYDPYSSSASSA